jgi:hypothetical protein
MELHHRTRTPQSQTRSYALVIPSRTLSTSLPPVTFYTATITESVTVSGSRADAPVSVTYVVGDDNELDVTTTLNDVHLPSGLGEVAKPFVARQGFLGLGPTGFTPLQYTATVGPFSVNASISITFDPPKPTTPWRLPTLTPRDIATIYAYAGPTLGPVIAGCLALPTVCTDAATDAPEVVVTAG